jgi:restriction system protein
MIGRSGKGLLITTGTFTPDAKREATRDGAPAIDLIDGDQLCDLLKQLKLGVHTEMVERMVVESSWFDGIRCVA